MAGLSTHVLDTSTGLPAQGVRVTHYVMSGKDLKIVCNETTDGDGRIKDLTNGSELTAGSHRLVFETGPWFATRKRPIFYPSVSVDFEVTETERHHHIPLLLSPFGYSTYRGS